MAQATPHAVNQHHKPSVAVSQSRMQTGGPAGPHPNPPSAPPPHPRGPTAHGPSCNERVTGCELPEPRKSTRLPVPRPRASAARGMHRDGWVARGHFVPPSTAPRPSASRHGATASDTHAHAQIKLHYQCSSQTWPFHRGHGNVFPRPNQRAHADNPTPRGRRMARLPPAAACASAPLATFISMFSSRAITK